MRSLILRAHLPGSGALVITIRFPSCCAKPLACSGSRPRTRSRRHSARPTTSTGHDGGDDTKPALENPTTSDDSNCRSPASSMGVGRCDAALRLSFGADRGAAAAGPRQRAGVVSRRAGDQGREDGRHLPAGRTQLARRVDRVRHRIKPRNRPHPARHQCARHPTGTGWARYR